MLYDTTTAGGIQKQYQKFDFPGKSYGKLRKCEGHAATFTACYSRLMSGPDAEGSSVAVLAEKPSVARDIARVLGANKQGQGYLHGNGYVVTWAIGHLVALAQPHEIQPGVEALAARPAAHAAARLAAGGLRKDAAPVRGGAQNPDLAESGADWCARPTRGAKAS